MFYGEKINKMRSYFYLCILLLLLFSSVYARHHHGGSDELLPAVCSNGETMLRSKHEEDIKSFENCPHQRSDAIAVMGKGFDLNRDGCLTMNECVLARNYYLTWYEKTVAEGCDTIFLHCDCDGDGRICPPDFEQAVFTCLRNCDSVEMINHFIASRMEGDKAFNGVKEKTTKVPM